MTKLMRHGLKWRRPAGAGRHIMTADGWEVGDFYELIRHGPEKWSALFIDATQATGVKTITLAANVNFFEARRRAIDHYNSEEATSRKWKTDTVIARREARGAARVIARGTTRGMTPVNGAPNMASIARLARNRDGR